MPPCYGPPEILAAYDVSGAHARGITGRSQTIVIIDAFQDPMLQSDFDSFNTMYSLPAMTLPTPSTPDGVTPWNPTLFPTQPFWAREIAIDVEWAHVIAPDATLLLVLAKTDQDADILSATKFAVDHRLGDVISMSFSEAESCPTAQFLADQHRTFQRAVAKGITLVAASGDFGVAQHTCNGSFVNAAGTPASDPLVTAVGGTTLAVDLISKAYQSEVGWSRSGGGFSTVYKRPGYQARAVTSSKMRGLPDVALSADAIGVTIAFALGHPGGSVGTSAPTAEWAGIAALLGQGREEHRDGSLNSFLYRTARSHASQDAFHDITSGNNSTPTIAGFAAGPGWDPVTGLGTPDVAKLVGVARPGDQGGEGGGDGAGNAGGDSAGNGGGDGGNAGGEGGGSGGGGGGGE